MTSGTESKTGKAGVGRKGFSANWGRAFAELIKPTADSRLIKPTVDSRLIKPTGTATDQATDQAE
ncbi:hypothetical protein [Streptomyces sp. NBC_00847]|uniref:hypothetical protein n=1 Tax=Streptomyces sp. NBC_00847 TaxID=2975850 RepID=UPI00224CA67F|nr:hypothetical protein [Streptomyces sp. NBC_00847]MCX4882209.1 hypothetical protein [Streptomyces sp. NBC_00847]